MASSEARPGLRCRVAALAAVILAACTPAAPPNPLEPPTCTVVYPHGLNGPAVCTDNPASVCTSGSSFCPLGFGGYCASLSIDVFNCGACNAACPQGGSCTGGTCSCPAGQVDCGGRCVDLSADPNNCGQCGQQCGEGVCSSGLCVCNTTPSTVERCGGSPACVDITSSPTDCGGCGNACPQLNAVCNSGTCACPEGATTVCPVGNQSVCVDLDSDPQHCGACGTACPTNGVCTGGTCACPQGTTLCGNTCANLSADSSNCGSCGNSCPGTCTAGSCDSQPCGLFGEPCCPGLVCYDSSSCNGLTCA
jgi:hypothetical protein